MCYSLQGKHRKKVHNSKHLRDKIIAQAAGMHAITVTARWQAVLNVFRNMKAQSAAPAGKLALSKMLVVSSSTCMLLFLKYLVHCT